MNDLQTSLKVVEVELAEVEVFLTPTEQRIELDRVAIPKFMDFKQKVREQSDKVEAMKNGLAPLAEAMAADWFSKAQQNTAFASRLFDNIASAVDGIDELSKAGCLILHKVPLLDGRSIKVYYLPSDKKPDDVMNELREKAKAELLFKVAKAEKELADLHKDIASYKKEVLRQKAAIVTLEDIMKDVL
ncbi:TPA: hypothetical protein JLG68_001374 [Escherichia coli]|nr:hypothetical protein [Escherichia coli]